MKSKPKFRAIHSNFMNFVKFAFNEVQFPANADRKLANIMNSWDGVRKIIANPDPLILTGLPIQYILILGISFLLALVRERHI